MSATDDAVEVVSAAIQVRVERPIVLAQLARDAVNAASPHLLGEVNDKVQDLAKRLLNEDIVDSLEILHRLANGELKLL